MPVLKVLENGICRVKEEGATTGESVSTFTISLRQRVDVDGDGGGPGFTATLKRLVDSMEV